MTTTTVTLGSDLCPVEGPKGRLAILIDVSDPLPPVGRKQVLNRLSDEAQTAKKSERVDIYTFGASDTLTNQLFSGCNP
ncbi:MAG: hypothetical protein V7695_19925, partial [Sulfitobacter sp.]